MFSNTYPHLLTVICTAVALPGYLGWGNRANIPSMASAGARADGDLGVLFSMGPMSKAIRKGVSSPPETEAFCLQKYTFFTLNYNNFVICNYFLKC